MKTSHADRMRFPPEVSTVLEGLLSGIREILRDRLVGVYLRGSLASGGFIPETSDIDALAATEAPVDRQTFEALAALHASLATRPTAYANRLEIAYLDRASLKRFQPGHRHPTLGQGEALTWREHHANWVLERWTVREHGVTLVGPDPKALIDPISSDAVRRAVRDRLRDWDEWACNPNNTEWGSRRHLAYVVETMCRALHTLRRGDVSTKQQAVRWAMEGLPEPYRSTVARASRWRTDDTVDPDGVPAVRDLVLWAASLTSPSAAPGAAAGGP